MIKFLLIIIIAHLLAALFNEVPLFQWMPVRDGAQWMIITYLYIQNMKTQDLLRIHPSQLTLSKKQKSIHSPRAISMTHHNEPFPKRNPHEQTPGLGYSFPTAPTAPPSPATTGGNIPTITRGKINRPQRIVLYGTAGIGKSSLAALLPNPVFLDLEDGTAELDVSRISAASYLDTRAALHTSALDSFGTVNLDTMTALQDLSAKHVLNTIRDEKGSSCTSIGDYGWGMGYRHIYDAMALVLADLDQQIAAGRHVCIIVHCEAVQAPNPQGKDWLRWEPQLQAQRSANIRNHLVQWADHVLFMGYSVEVEKDGKAKNQKVRLLYPSEDPTLLAKSRRLRDSRVIVEGDTSIWKGIIT